MTVVIGITGGIASGKTAIATMFAELGAHIFNADKAVHELYQNADIIQYFATHYPSAVIDGTICRHKLAAMIHKDATMLPRIEAFIHPKVQQKERTFIQEKSRFDAGMVVVDIPLMIETGAQSRFDYTLLVTAPYWLRKKRAFRRHGMSEEKWALITSHQYPDHVKRKYVDYCITTGLGLAESRRQVKQLHHRIITRNHHAT